MRADLPRRLIHGDFGLHNLLFEGATATVMDVELARIDLRLTDLLLVLGKHLDGGDPDVEALGAFFDGYGPLGEAERAAVGEAWRYQCATSAVRSWLSAMTASEPAARVAAAHGALDRAGWVDEHPREVARWFGAEAVTPDACLRRCCWSCRRWRSAARRRRRCPWRGTCRRPGGARRWPRSPTGRCGRPSRPTGVPVEVVADRRHRAIALPWFVADMVRMRRALLDVLAAPRRPGRAGPDAGDGGVPGADAPVGRARAGHLAERERDVPRRGWIGRRRGR